MLTAELAEAYEHASVVNAFMATGVFRPSGADVLAELDGIIGRADAAGAGCSGDDLAAAREVHAYAVLLAIVYRGFLDAGGSGRRA